MSVHFAFCSVSKCWAMKCACCSGSSCDWLILLTSGKCTRLGCAAVHWQAVLNWWAVLAGALCVTWHPPALGEGTVVAEERSPVSRLRGAGHQWPPKVAHRSSQLCAFWSSSAKCKECGAGLRCGLGLIGCSGVGAPVWSFAVRVLNFWKNYSDGSQSSDAVSDAWSQELTTYCQYRTQSKEL